MSIQDTIDELTRIGNIHGFHQPVELHVPIDWEDLPQKGSDDLELTLHSVEFKAGVVALEPIGTSTVANPDN